MNAQALTSIGFGRLDVSAHAATATLDFAPPRNAADTIDLAGARVHLDDPALGVIPAWYFDVKPRGAAAVVPLPTDAWHDGQPTADIRARVALLNAHGVAVLLVDARRRGVLSLWWRAGEEAGALGLWRRPSDEAFVRAARGYLEDRGHCAENIGVVRAG